MSEQPKPRTSFDPKRLILPAIIFLVAMLIRLPGLTWGLKDSQHNQSLHPDEELNFRVSRALDPVHLKFTPDWYHYGTLYFTALRVVDDVVYGYTGGSDHPDHDWDYIRKGELAGRVLSVVSGTLLCVVVFYATRRITTEVGAVIAGLCVAMSPALVVHSRFATVDMTATLFIALSALYALKLLADEEPLWVRWAILAGVGAGLSAGTKYTGGLAVLMPIAAILLRRPPGTPRLVGMSLFASLAAFVISTPGSVLQASAFMRDFNYERIHTATGHGMVFTGTSTGFVYHIANLFLGIGVVLTVLGAGAVVQAGLRKQRWAWVLLAFALPYYLLIGTAQVKFMRYVFPLSIAVAAGVGSAVGEGWVGGGRGRIVVAFAIAGLGGLDGGGLRGAWRFTSAMLGQDHREMVKPLVLLSHPRVGESDITVGLISDPWFWSPTLYPDITMGLVPPSYREALMSASSHPHVERFAPPDGSPPIEFDPRLVTVTKPDFITYSDFETVYVDRVSYMAAPPSRFADDVARYHDLMQALTRDYTLVAQFGDAGDMVEDMRYVMPTVYVWKRNP